MEYEPYARRAGPTYAKLRRKAPSFAAAKGLEKLNLLPHLHSFRFSCHLFERELEVLPSLPPRI